MTSKNDAVGTLAWGRRTGGILSSSEAGRALRNALFVRTRDRFDRMRRALGLLRPVDVDLETLAPPDSAFALDALRYAEETHARALLFHSWRSYYFGALIARHDGMKFDPEVYFAAAILHDVGLTQAAAAPHTRCCFAISGGQQACDHLAGKGHEGPKAARVGEAIALHLNLAVSARDHGPEAFMVARGAVCDALGAGLARIGRRPIREATARYPRAGLREALFVRDHRTGTRAELLTRFAGSKVPEHPLDAAGLARG